MNQTLEEFKWGKIKITYIDKVYESIFIDLKDKEMLNIFLHISEYGTSDMPSFKIPTSKTSFIIFSREQLDHCVFELDLYKTKPRKKKKEPEMIKS